MSVSVIQLGFASSSGFSGSNTVSVTLSSAVTAGNALVASFGGVCPASSVGITINGVSDGTNSYASAVANSGSFNDAFSNLWFLASQTWFAGNVAGGSPEITVTFTITNLTGSRAPVELIVYEVAGLGTAPSVDSSNTGSNATFPPSISITPVATNTFALGSFVSLSNSEPVGNAGSGWTLDVFNPTNINFGSNVDWVNRAFEHQILASNAGLNANFGSGYTVSGGGWLGTAVTITPGTGPTYSISGNIDTAFGNVSAGAANTTADGSGDYTLSGLPDSTYSVVPSKGGVVFTPTNQSVTISGADVTGIDFTAAAAPPGTAAWLSVDLNSSIRGIRK